MGVVELHAGKRKASKVSGEESLLGLASTVRALIFRGISAGLGLGLALCPGNAGPLIG